MFLFGLLLMLAQMMESQAGGREDECQAEMIDTVASAAAAPCLALGPFGAIFCPKAVPLATDFATKQCEGLPNKRSIVTPRKNRFNSTKIERSASITPQLMYKLDLATFERCTWEKNGKQKCVGRKGFITCVNNQWTVTQLCGPGTRCRPYPGSKRHVLCGW